MSWIQKLYETYEACHSLDEDPKKRPWPVSHFVKQAHVEVVLDGEGNFRKGRTRKLEWNEAATLIPATEKSAGRTAGIAPHPLCEEVGYMAADLPVQKHLQAIEEYGRLLDGYCNILGDQFPRVRDEIMALFLSYKTQLGLDSSVLSEEETEDDTGPDEEEKNEKASKIDDFEIELKRICESHHLPEYLSKVPEILSKKKRTLARKIPKFSKMRSAYDHLLNDWCTSEYRHQKVAAIRKYLNNGSLWSDLSSEGVFPFSVANGDGVKTKVDDDKVFVRWRVETPGDPASGTWEDSSIIDSWARFDAARNSKTGLCIATGEEVRLAQNHPRFLRYPGDGAKLISANDFSGLTFKGRFTDDKSDYQKQVCSAGFEVSQKAHNALRWLINRQGYRSGDLVVVSWAISGQQIPDPCASSLDLFTDESLVVEQDSGGISDSGQSFALRLKRAIAGYGCNLDPSADIVVMGIDSATPGRMGITFYRELKGSDFLARIEDWHTKCAWSQNFSKDKKFVGAPAPKDIAEAAYGRTSDEKLSKATVERLLPCIIDGVALPRDLVDTTMRRVSNRVGFKDHWEWEKCLGIACALFRGYHKERSYQMALEEDRMSRDYLYGRLLAIADNVEGYALRFTEEGKKRDTTAARLMQRFAARPFSTWANIELALNPYMARLKAGSEKSAGFLAKRRVLLDEVISALDNCSDRTSDAPLTGEFLLGFHTQRQSLWGKGDATETDESSTDEPATN